MTHLPKDDDGVLQEDVQLEALQLVLSWSWLWLWLCYVVGFGWFGVAWCGWCERERERESEGGVKWVWLKKVRLLPPTLSLSAHMTLYPPNHHRTHLRSVRLVGVEAREDEVVEVRVVLVVVGEGVVPERVLVVPVLSSS